MPSSAFNRHGFQRSKIKIVLNITFVLNC